MIHKYWSKNWLRIFPKDIGLESTYVKWNRIRQLIRLLLFCFNLSNLMGARNIEPDFLAIVETKGYKNSIDENMYGFISSMIDLNQKICILGLPPGAEFKLLKNNQQLISYSANRLFIIYLLFGIIIGIDKSIYNFWKYILNYIKPKFVITYMPSEELCLAGRNLSIKVIDLQHGGIHLNQEIYKSYKKNRKALPSLLLAWNIESLENAKKLAIADDYFLLGYPESYNIEVLNKKKEKKNITCLITLTRFFSILYKDFSQANINEKNNIIIPNLYSILSDKEFDNITWLLRLHPLTSKHEEKLIDNRINELTNRYKFLKIKTDKSNSLLNCLRTVDFHITLASSVSIKCELMNIFTIATCPIFYENQYLKTLESKGICKILKPGYTKLDLKKAIHQAIYYNEHNNTTSFIKYIPHKLLSQLKM